MGRRGSWFSAIKKVFANSSKEKVTDGTDKKSSKEKKKKGHGKHKQGDGHSFIPLFRKPSSIEEILGEAEREHHNLNYRSTSYPLEQPKAPPHETPPPPPPPLRIAGSPLKIAASPRTSTPPRAPSPRKDVVVKTTTSSQPSSPPLQRVASPPHATRAPSPRFVHRYRPEPSLKEQHVFATMIQATFRGYMGRRSYRALRGFVRLQSVVKGQSVKRQTANAMKCMQLLVRVQTQIHSRRVQMLENQAQQRQALYKNDKDLSKWISSEDQGEWDDSTLPKEEKEARIQRKIDAVLKRERAMAYAHSHQLWKSTPKFGQSALMDIRSGGFPYWWNWLEQRQVPPRTPTIRSQSPAIKSFHMTPTRSKMDSRTSSPIRESSNLGQTLRGFENLDTSTPRSTKSAIPTRMKLPRTPPGRLQQKFSRGSATNSPFNGASPFKDDDSLTSCPPFSVPRYMSPTVSAKAKLRVGKEHIIPDSPTSTIDESNRRTSFPLGQDFKWNNKGGLFSDKETSSSQKALGKQSVQSVGNMSVDSTVSVPATVGRKPFNRFA